VTLVVVDLYDFPDLYDALLPVGAHLPYYMDLARQQDGPALELACGTGQLAVPIAAAGAPIAGLDLAPAMLATARHRATAAGVALDLVEGDMRAFDLGRRFGLVFVARNSLLHLNRWVVSMRVRSIFPQELPLLLAASGLRLKDRFGDLARRPFGTGSPQQVCLCEATP
jgi:SAM-dependent methyltransferase